MSETTTREHTAVFEGASGRSEVLGTLGAWFDAAATTGRFCPDPLAIDAVERAVLGLDTEPQRIGRYEVLHQVGAGGMGIVYRAFDPVLRREVAVKLVRRTSSMPRASARLRREASALAQLDHPNVVPVYDFTDDGGRLCVVMKFVTGDDLARWLRRERRDWRSILSVFMDAGRGLAAAHAAGIVHRDVKPTNIIVETGGQVQVADFGLARLMTSGEATDPDPCAEADPVPDPPTSLTRTGDVLGTPAYMAPEQMAGQAATAASDQFSLCAALYEALTGQRPFPGSDVVAIAETMGLVRRGELMRRRGPVPRPVMRAILRGLARRPGDRWPSMEALLDHLQPPARSRRAWAIAGVVALASGVALLRPSNSADCARLDRSLSAERPRAPAGQSAELAEGLGRLEGELRSYASRWSHERERVCEAGAAPPEATPRFSVRCLELAASEFDQTVRILVRDPQWSAREGAMLVAGLSDPERCTREAAPPVAPSHPAEHDLARAFVALRASDVATARALLDDALAQPGARVHPRVTTEAMLVRARIAQQERRSDEARSQLLAAYSRAVADDLDDLAVRAANLLAYDHAVGERPGDEAEAWLRHMDTAIARGQLPDRYRAMYLTTAGLVHTHTGSLLRAREELKEAIVVATAVYGGAAPPVADALENLSEVEARLGDHPQGVAVARRAHEIFLGRFGPDHRKTMQALDTLAVRLAQGGELDEARGLLEGLRSAARLDERLGVEVLEHLGGVHWMAGRPGEALATYQQALDELSRIEPSGGMLWARLSSNTGAAMVELERYAEAVPLFERAVSAYVEHLGPGHPLVSSQLWNLGWAQRYARRREDARRTFERALKLAEPRSGDDDRDFEGVLAQWATEDLEPAGAR